MLLGYLLGGVLVGLLGFGLALGAGLPVWMAVGAYSAAGLIGVLVVAGLVWLRPQGAESPGVAAIPSAQDRPDSAAAPTEGAPFRILAVDDDPFIRELLPKVAARVGCPDVTVAGSGRRALALIAAQPRRFDCLLLDISMPDMDGITLCARIRAQPGYHSTPIIMLTAMTDTDHLQRAFAAGATDYTTKPFDIIDLGARLATSRPGARAGAVSSGGPDDLAAWISPQALRAFVSRLGRTARARSLVIGVRQLVGPGGEPQPHVTQCIAQAIEQAFGARGYLMAETAPGLLVVVLGDGDPVDVHDRLDLALAAAGLADMACIGTALRPGSGGVAGVQGAITAAATLTVGATGGAVDRGARMG